MSEDADALLAGEAEEAAAVVPGEGIGALGLGDDGDGLERREPVEGDGFGEGEEELPRLEHLHGDEGLPGEAGEALLQRVGFLAKRRVMIGLGLGLGLGSVDAERSIGAGEEELGAVGFDGFDLGRAIGHKLHTVVGAVHHLPSFLPSFLPPRSF